MIKNITFFSHTYMQDSLFKVGSHHLAKEFSKLGLNVDYFSTPISPLHFLKNNQEIKNRISIYSSGGCKKDNIQEYVLMNYLPYIKKMPLFYYEKIYKFSEIWNFRHLFKKYKTDLILIDQPIMSNLLKYIETDKIIYRPTDVYWSYHEDWTLKKIEKTLCKNVDGIISTSTPVKEYIDKICGNKISKSIVIENGVDYEHFSKKRERPSQFRNILSPIAIYVGALDQRFDFRLLLETAKRCADIHFIIIGPMPSNELYEFEKLHNIDCLGAIAYEKIPAFLQHSNVGIMPFKNNQLNQGRSPMKFYEYTAAGIPIVATDLEEMKRRNYKHVLFANGANEFSNAIKKAIDGNYDKKYLDDVAKKQSWEKKALEILDFVKTV